MTGLHPLLRHARNFPERGADVLHCHFATPGSGKIGIVHRLRDLVRRMCNFRNAFFRNLVADQYGLDFRNGHWGGADCAEVHGRLSNDVVIVSPDCGRNR